MAAEVVDIRRGRVPLPHDPDAEASVLGGIILRNELLAELQDLETADFYEHKHRVVFEAIRNLQHAGRPIDVVTLEDSIENEGKLEAIGGVAFLGELALHVPIVDNVIAYRDIVRRDSRNRKAILALSSAAERARNWPHDPAELIAEVRGELERLEDLGAPPERRLHLMSIDDALDDLGSFVDAQIYSTPFATLNRALGFDGMIGTQVYQLAGGTGRGKTSFVGGIAAHVAGEVGAPVIVSVHELGPGYFVARKAAGLLSCHSNEILRGAVERELIRRVMPYSNMYFLKRPGLRELREAAEFVRAKHGRPPLVIVDYLQKLANQLALRMQRPDLRLATNDASMALIDIADETGAAVLSVSSIGRGKAMLKNPRKHAPFELVEVAKESGDVEYDGAGVIVLSLSNDLEGEERIGTITVAKARFGTEVHIDARYHGARGLWRDCGEVDVEEPPAKISKPAAPLDERVDTVRAAIIASFIADGPADNKTNLKGRIQGFRKNTIGAVIEAMISKREIVRLGGRLCLSPNTQQASLEGLR